MAKKKIIHCLYNLKQGGAEQMVIDLSNFQSKNYEVILLTFWNDDYKDTDNLSNRLDAKVYSLDLDVPRSSKIKTIWRLYRKIKELDPDVVHMHMGRMTIFLLLPILFIQRVLYVQTCHTDPQFEAKNFIERIYRTLLYKLRLVEPVVLTKDFQSRFGTYFYGIKPFCVSNGRPFKRKTRMFENIVKEVRSLQKTPETKVFIHVARYAKEKNQMMLFNSIQTLNNKGFDIILLVLGSGFESIERDIAAKYNNSCIHFLGMKENVEDYLYCSDAFCLSSTYEGVPLSLIEAMSVGCIPIVTPVGALCDMLQYGKLGFISASLDQSDYEAALLQFLKNNHVDISDLQKHYADFYSIEQMVNNYNAIYFN